MLFFQTAHMWDIWKEIQFKVIDANWRSFQDLKWTRSLDVDKSTFRQQRISLKSIWGLVNLWTWGQLDPLYSEVKDYKNCQCVIWPDYSQQLRIREKWWSSIIREESWGFYPQRGGQMKVIKTHTHTEHMISFTDRQSCGSQRFNTSFAVPITITLPNITMPTC